MIICPTYEAAVRHEYPAVACVVPAELRLLLMMMMMMLLLIDWPRLCVDQLPLSPRTSVTLHAACEFLPNSTLSEEFLFFPKLMMVMKNELFLVMMTDWPPKGTAF